MYIVVFIYADLAAVNSKLIQSTKNKNIAYCIINNFPYSHMPTNLVVIWSNSNCSWHAKVTNFHIVMINHQYIPCSKITMDKPNLFKVLHPLLIDINVHV